MKHTPHAGMFGHTKTLSICKSYDLPFYLCSLSDVAWGSFHFNSENIVNRVETWVQYSMQQQYEHKFCKMCEHESG